MAVTIQVNGKNLSLVHQGSAGVVKSTLPDVCKTPTPGGPVPIPYPVIVSLTSDLKKGSKTVLVDGGNPAAVKGSQLSRCTGDEPGTLGGVKSGTNMKEATWLTYSFDVIIEGRNACRLSDKLLMNHGNTACLGGIVQPAILIDHPQSAIELEILCNMMCEEAGKAGRKQDRIAAKLWALDDASGGRSTMKAEVPFNPSKGTPYMSIKNAERATRNFFIRGHRRPDVIITDGSPPIMENIKTVVEMKFKGDPSTGEEAQKRLRAYERIFGEDNLVILEEGKTCICEDEDGEKEPVKEPVTAPEPSPVSDAMRVSVPEPDTNWWLVGAAGVLAVATVVAAIVPFDGPAGEIALGSATAATWASAFGG